MKTLITIAALVSLNFAGIANARQFNLECVEASDRTMPYMFTISTELSVPEALFDGSATQEQVLADASDLSIRYNNFIWTFDNNTHGPKQGALYNKGHDAKGVIDGFSDSDADYQYWLDLTLQNAYVFDNGVAYFNPNFTTIFTETDDGSIEDYSMDCQLTVSE